MDRVDIFAYDDYRAFLRAYYDLLRQSFPSFSLRHFSEMVDVGTPNLVKFILDGKRNLTVANIHRFATAINLSPREYDYFVALVHFTQEKSDSTQNYYKQRMDELKAAAKLARGLGVSLAELFENVG